MAHPIIDQEAHPHVNPITKSLDRLSIGKSAKPENDGELRKNIGSISNARLDKPVATQWVRFTDDSDVEIVKRT